MVCDAKSILICAFQSNNRGLPIMEMEFEYIINFIMNNVKADEFV